LTARKGQLEKNNQKGTARKRLPWQDFQDMSQDRTARTGLPSQDCTDKTTRAEQKAEDNQKRTGMQGS
jgi:hypothetical protein